MRVDGRRTNNHRSLSPSISLSPLPPPASRAVSLSVDLATINNLAVLYEDCLHEGHEAEKYYRRALELAVGLRLVAVAVSSCSRVLASVAFALPGWRVASEPTPKACCRGLSAGGCVSGCLHACPPAHQPRRMLQIHVLSVVLASGVLLPSHHPLSRADFSTFRLILHVRIPLISFPFPARRHLLLPRLSSQQM